MLQRSVKKKMENYILNSQLAGFKSIIPRKWMVAHSYTLGRVIKNSAEL